MNSIESARIMYEIYREEGYGRRFRVVYFTELTEHNKEAEINRALAGIHVHDGFIGELRKDACKEVIEDYLRRWNDGEGVEPAALEAALERITAGPV